MSLWFRNSVSGFWIMYLVSEQFIWFLYNVSGFWTVYQVLNSLFGFWTVYLVSEQSLWFLNSESDFWTVYLVSKSECGFWTISMMYLVSEECIWFRNSFFLVLKRLSGVWRFYIGAIDFICFLYSLSGFGTVFVVSIFPTILELQLVSKI